MNLRGLVIPATVFCFFLVNESITLADDEASSDLKYESLSLDGKVLDLIYPIQEMSGVFVGPGQKSGDIGGTGQSLQGEVTDLKAAGADIKETSDELKITLQGEILFDFDKWNLRPAAEPTLSQIAGLIKKTTKPSVVIEGHTDSKGSDSYNMKLSDRRAASVKAWLVDHGIKSGSIRTQGLGASKPIASNKKPNGADDPEGRQKNRRVEITIKK